MTQPTMSTVGPLSRHVRERLGPRSQTGVPNVGETERLVSLAVGCGLTLFGLKRGTVGGVGLALLGGSLIYRGATGYCACYEALGLDTAASRGRSTSVPAQQGAKVEESVTIFRPREELYRFWRDLSNLPRIMPHLISVQSTGEGRSHWVARGPLGSQVEWDAELITEKENELIGWRSIENSEVDTAGSVHFLSAPEGRGTEVKVVLKYDPPAGQLGIAVARLLGESPSQQIHEDLRRFKHFMESGTVPTTKEEPRSTRD